MSASWKGTWTGSGSPLGTDSPEVWDRLVEAADPPGMIVAIGRRMGPVLRARLSPEDVWQETLLIAWERRDSCRADGIGAFRGWLLGIAQHRIGDLTDRAHAKKRGGGRAPLPLRVPVAGRTSVFAGPTVTTTPSRVASDREIAHAMEQALEALDDEVRDVVALRIFEDLALPEIAERLGITLAAVRHRFRKGATTYHQRLQKLRHAP